MLNSMLNEMKELAERHHEASEDYDKAIASWDAARQDIYHFSGLWTKKTREWTA